MPRSKAREEEYTATIEGDVNGERITRNYSKSTKPVTDMPPGPIQLEVRVDGKIKFLQRVHSYHIDQQAHQAVITGALRPTIEVSSDGE